MKKNLSKLFAMALALIMVMALTVPAMAVQEIASGLEGTGTITITNATLGEDYAIYKVFDATYSGDENASYTIHRDSDWYDTINSKSDMFVLTASAGDPDVYVVSFVEGMTGEAVRDYLAGVVEGDTVTINPDASTPDGGATDVEVKFTGVAYGYYLVQSSLGEGTVTVTNAKPNATVIDKNQEPIPETEFKTATDTSVEVGETTTFTVEFTTTNYDGETKITKYDVKDTMADTMQMVTDTLVVKVGETVLVKDTDYTGDVTEDGFDIDINWVDEDGDFLYTSPNKLTITYDAKLLATATVAGEGNTNKAEIGYNGTTSKTDIEKLYTYALAIKKIDKSGNGLAGATFVLKDAEGTEIKVSGSNGEYTVDPNGTDTITSPESGLIVIKGVDSDEYTLTETAAPLGYNLLTAPVAVTPTATTETITRVTKYLDEDGNVVETETSVPVTIELDNVAATPVFVVNFTGTELPSTGGMGTTLFYTIGGLLVVCAGVLLVTKKRMNNMEG